MNAATDMILVVDDEEIQLEILYVQLLNMGWKQICFASSGVDALAQYDAHGKKISIIISDLSMPGMDGAVLMRNLAQRGCKAGIILLSGLDDHILISAAGLANAHGLRILGILPKPCMPDSLKKLLQAALPNSPPPGSAPQLELLSFARLGRALALEEFTPWYQPKVDIRSNQAVSLEALARWPQRGGRLIEACDFIPAIEAACLCDELFFLMARQIVADLLSWRCRGIQLAVAINLSMDTAHNLGLPEWLLQLVVSAGLSPRDLIVEVTESRLMVDRPLAMETLTRLSLMGFGLSIDDFGTGYSSLTQLADLPFTEIKIDGSFVRRASQERKAQAIVRSSIQIGANLGMDVIAEGVETSEQLEFLRSCGCTLVQGYLIARPMPFSACTDWLCRA